MQGPLSVGMSKGSRRTGGHVGAIEELLGGSQTEAEYVSSARGTDEVLILMAYFRMRVALRDECMISFLVMMLCFALLAVDWFVQ